MAPIVCRRLQMLLPLIAVAAGSMVEPYPYLNGGSFVGAAAPASPDPLVRYQWNDSVNQTELQVFFLQPQQAQTDAPASFAGLETIYAAACNITVSGTGTIFMDFGQENAAWLEFDSPQSGLSDAVLMSISEYNQPAVLGMAGGNAKTASPKEYPSSSGGGSTYRLELNSELYEGVRYGWINVTAFSSPWTITAVRIVCQIKPTNYSASFATSDDLINTIWYTAAYTVKLNLLQDYFGAILMYRGDRYSWTGDAHVAQAAALVAFGDYSFVKENLDRTATDCNGIESYCLYWVLSLVDYFTYSGDSAAVLGYMANVDAKLSHARDIYGQGKNLVFFGWDERVGAGFENAGCPEAQRAYEMITIRAHREFAAVLQQLNQNDTANKYLAFANQYIQTLCQDPEWYTSFGLHACADAVNAGFTTAEEQAAIFAQEFNDTVQICSLSNFNQYWILQALGRIGQIDAALASVRRCWGNEVALGGTTFWEVSSPEWLRFTEIGGAVPNSDNGFTSYCHPWSAGPVKWLHDNTIGIRPTRPGFASYEIAPRLGSSLDFVRGSLMTPCGRIAVDYDVRDASGSFEAPSGCRGRLALPVGDRRPRSVSIDGVAVAAESPLPATDGLVVLEDIPAGRHTVSVQFDAPYKAPPPAVQAPLVYAGAFIGSDSTTSGNWPGKYGAAGYVLFGQAAGQNDVMELPSWVSAVNSFSQATRSVWATDTTDQRALAPGPNGLNSPRIASCNYAAGTPTNYVDVILTSSRPYRVALYYLDWDSRGRRQVMNMFDYATKDLVAPVAAAESFVDGVYHVFEYDQSARFRLMLIRGDNAVLSGMFFDEA